MSRQTTGKPTGYIMNRVFESKTLGSEWVGLEIDLDIYGYQVQSERGEDLGVVQDYVFDERGRLRYLVAESGFWIFGKRFLIPVGLADVEDFPRCRVRVRRLSPELLQELPGFEDLDDLTPEYEAELCAYYREGRMRSGEDMFAVPDRLRRLEDRMERLG
jgi:hypothetical protein